VSNQSLDFYTKSSFFDGSANCRYRPFLILCVYSAISGYRMCPGLITFECQAPVIRGADRAPVPIRSWLDTQVKNFKKLKLQGGNPAANSPIACCLTGHPLW
jgi:hypothetical protein